MIKLKNIFLIVLFFPIILSGCGKKSNYGTTEKNFQDKRFPRDNEFIMNGGYKIKLPKNPFISSKQAVEIYNKNDKNSLSNIPNVPEN